MYTLKKSLGQHFLHDENICRKIVATLEQYEFNNLLEIGPGGGALTKYLLQIKNIHFKAIELDGEKVQYLVKMYPQLKDKIIHKDFLDMDKPYDSPFTIIGNFPYNISSQILFKVLHWKDEVETVIGMFQKEVAQRIASHEGNKVYGVLSVLVQAYFKVEYLFDVPENSFTPPPNVKSAVIRLSALPERPVMKSESDFLLLVKTAFNQRRKMLRNGVKNLFDIRTLQESIFSKRAEQLSINDFAALTFKMI